MPRVYLTLEDNLFNLIEEDSDKNNITMNLLIQNVLERIYMGDLNYNDIVEKIGLDTVRFDYTAALNELIAETNDRDDGEFTLSMLDSFSKQCISTVEKGYLQPSTLRARLGKLYNSAVKKDMVKDHKNRILPGVERAIDNHGNLKFKSRNAVYIKRSIVQEENEVKDEK